MSSPITDGMLVQCSIVGSGFPNRYLGDQPLGPRVLTESPLKMLQGNQRTPALEYRYAIANRMMAGFHALNPVVAPADYTAFDQFRLFKTMTYRIEADGQYDHTYVSNIGTVNIPTSTLPNDPGVGDDGMPLDPTPVIANAPTESGLTPAQILTKSDTGSGTATHTLNPDIASLEECTLSNEWDYADTLTKMKNDVNTVDFGNLWTNHINLNIGYDEWPRTTPSTNLSSFRSSLGGPGDWLVIANVAPNNSGAKFTTTQPSNSLGADPHASAFTLTQPDAGFQFYQASWARVQVRGISLPPDGIDIVVFEVVGPAYNAIGVATSLLVIRDQHHLMPHEIYELPQPSLGDMTLRSSNGYSYVSASSQVKVQIGGLSPGEFGGIMVNGL